MLWALLFIKTMLAAMDELSAHNNNAYSWC